MREALKTVALAVATAAITPLLLSYRVRAWLLGPDRALEGSTQLLALAPGLTGDYLRRAFLRRTIAYCATSATIGFGTTFSQAGARIDEHAYVGPGCRLGLVHIEKDVLLASDVHVPSGGATHGTELLDRPIREQPSTRTLVRIGEGSWIGSAAIVLADIGRHSVVGAGAVVTHAVPDYVIAVGVPARVVRDRREGK